MGADDPKVMLLAGEFLDALKTALDSEVVSSVTVRDPISKATNTMWVSRTLANLIRELQKKE